MGKHGRAAQRRPTPRPAAQPPSLSSRTAPPATAFAGSLGTAWPSAATRTPGRQRRANARRVARGPPRGPHPSVESHRSPLLRLNSTAADVRLFVDDSLQRDRPARCSEPFDAEPRFTGSAVPCDCPLADIAVDDFRRDERWENSCSSLLKTRSAFRRGSWQRPPPGSSASRNPSA